MKKLFQLKKLVFILLLLQTTICFSQRLDHVLGEIVFQLESDASLDSFTKSITDNTANPLNTKDLKAVSSPLHIWKISFDHNLVHEQDFLQEIRNNPFVVNAQFNYFTTNRTEPNDPLFEQQWFFKNTSQNGGLPDIDLDATIAWASTTGGLTLNGDTIVVCVIDESYDYFHSDLQENIWVNHQEIPNNGIDDDDNGYIDDYRGWNVSTNNDSILNPDLSDWHGSAMAGIIGGKGNNEKGITGINWNIKMMLVSRGNTTEDAIAAYTYPLLNRKKFNETFGAEGSFIVATNTSWGIDFGTPDDAPLWCAMYDSLGNQGILNAAATTNSNVNVDISGDLPTSCESEFLITVTSVDHNDEKLVNAGYGALSIDLGAFGENIVTTLVDDSYAPINGTSAAAPQVAGTIGLLHSAACPDFATLAIYDPKQSALQLKEYILNGTEYNASLTGITSTGGRLNIGNSLELLMDDCAFAACYTPFAFSIESISTNSVEVNWITNEVVESVNCFYREQGTSNWITLINCSSPLTLNALEPCTTYEYQFESVCNTGLEALSEIYTFKTDGCCDPPQAFSFGCSANSIHIEWEEITAAIGYLLKYRLAQTTNWTQVNLTENYFDLNGLVECQAYEFQVLTICNGNTSNLSAIQSHSTIGCDACTEFDFCSINGPAAGFTWISRVALSNLESVSENSMNGYSDNTDLSANLIQGFVHDIHLETDFELIPFNGFFSVWIDLNQNGIFNQNELMLQSNSPQSELSKQIFIPPGTLPGSTRMRIMFKEDIDPCGYFESSLFGEVEDYCVHISEPTECLPPVVISTQANEFHANLTWSGNQLIDDYLINYRASASNNWQNIITNSTDQLLSNLTPCTDYEYFITSICDGVLSNPSPIQYFKTLGCGTCIDYQYCEYSPCTVDFEWIERFRLDAIENISGSNNGYSQFPDFNANLNQGESYPIELEPGFSNDHFEELFYVWIDFNQDGFFNDITEQVYEGLSSNGEILFDNIFIPPSAKTGSTRLRVSMKYSDDEIIDPCESGFFGEIEEYCINIIAANQLSCNAPSFSSSERVDSSTAEVFWEDVGSSLIAYHLRYKLSSENATNWKYLYCSENYAYLENLSNCLDYDLEIQTICPNGLSPFASLSIFNTCELVSTTELGNEEKQINIYPNPFSTKTNLSIYSDRTEPIDIKILNSIGQVIKTYSFETEIGENTFELNLDTNNSGVYFIQIQGRTSSSLVTKKIIYQTP